MKYSVIIPLYNKEMHIARSIQSVLGQNYNDFEIIVVDDGSDDAGLSVVRQFKDDRIQVYQQKNSGVSSARNMGIQKARGEYLAFLDADDEWLENHLESFEEMLVEFPNAGLYATAYEVHKSAENVQNLWEEASFCKTECIVDIDFFKESYIEGRLPIHTSSVCIPMRVINERGVFKVGCHHGEDLDMWGRIALEYLIVFYCKVSSRYYQDTQNCSINTRPVERYELPFVTFFRENQRDIESKIDNPFIREYVAMQELLVARRLITSGNRRDAWKVLLGIKTRHLRKKLIQFYLGLIVPTKILKLYMKLIKLKMINQ